MQLNAEQRANAIFDVLVRLAGASESDRAQFVPYVARDDDGFAWEFRFCGSLGFGGKYRPRTNRVDCYREDETPARLAVIKDTNAALALLNGAADAE